MRSQFLSALLLACAPLTVLAAPPSQTRDVALADFMQRQLSAAPALPIPVPTEYEAATLPDTPVGYSYWMHPADVAEAAKSGNLPAERGYMYGKISTDIGYDRPNDRFIGLEDPAFLNQAKGVFSSLTVERCIFDGHPVALVTAETAGAGTVVYSAYVPMGVETNTVYLAYRPPANDRAAGDSLFARLRASLSNCRIIAGGA